MIENMVMVMVMVMVICIMNAIPRSYVDQTTAEALLHPHQFDEPIEV